MYYYFAIIIKLITCTRHTLQVMCMQYWPPALDKKERYGSIHIGIDNEEQLANFHIRTFRIWKQDVDVSRTNKP